MILLDSSVFIELFRKSSKEETLFHKLALSGNSFGISAITCYEVGIGNRNPQLKDYWEKLIGQMSILPFNKECSLIAIEIYFDLLKKNKMIDLADIFIAATAITNKIPIATLNIRHFERIHNLEIIKQ